MYAAFSRTTIFYLQLSLLLCIASSNLHAQAPAFEIQRVEAVDTGDDLNAYIDVLASFIHPDTEELINADDDDQDSDNVAVGVAASTSTGYNNVIALIIQGIAEIECLTPINSYTMTAEVASVTSTAGSAVGYPESAYVYYHTVLTASTKWVVGENQVNAENENGMLYGYIYMVTSSSSDEAITGTFGGVIKRPADYGSFVWAYYDGSGYTLSGFLYQAVGDPITLDEYVPADIDEVFECSVPVNEGIEVLMYVENTAESQTAADGSALGGFAVDAWFIVDE